MNFHNVACDHLAQYKMNVMGVKKDGLFHYRGRVIPKPYILPIDDREMNILERYRDQFWSSNYSRIELHRFFHHLNSSQALCFNLFYPLIAEKALGFFLQYLCIPPEADPCALFEKKSDIEMAARRTSFDFYVHLAAENNIFVEVKYTENGFGQAKNDQKHRSKFLKTYLPLVKKKSLFIETRCQEEVFFLSHYQILRNLVHISYTDYVVLLFPSANTVVAEETAYAMDKLLTKKGKARLRIVFLDAFVSFLENRCLGGPLDRYYQAFRAKYLPH